MPCFNFSEDLKQAGFRLSDIQAVFSEKKPLNSGLHQHRQSIYPELQAVELSSERIYTFIILCIALTYIKRMHEDLIQRYIYV